MAGSTRRDALLVAASLFVPLAAGAFFGVPGKSVAGAWRVLQGETPYRNWWTMYAPGNFYAVAALLAVGGKQLLVPALASCAVRAATAGMFFAFARRTGASRGVALAVALVLGLASFEIAPELSSYPLAFALIAWALIEVVRYARGEGERRLVRAGLALGVAAVFKHDVAGYATLAVAIGLAAAWTLAGNRRPAAWRSPLRASAMLLGPAALVVALAALWLAFAAGRDAWQDLVAFPLGDFRLVRSEPYPPWIPQNAQLRAWLADPSDIVKARDASDAFATWVLGNAPQIAFAAGVLWVASHRRRLAPDRLAAACVLLATIPFYWWAAHTQQNTHLTSMAVASFLLGAIAWTEVPRARWALLAFGAFYAAGLAVDPIANAALPLKVWSRPVPLGLPRTAGIFVSPRERELYRAVYDLVQERVPPSEPIFTGVARSDAIVINNPRFAFLVGRRAATRHHELHPGITDRPAVQREMIADLEREHVRCAVIWRFGWSKATLDAIVARRKAMIPDCGATLLDEYLAEHFEPVLEVDEYVVLWRKGEATEKIR